MSVEKEFHYYAILFTSEGRWERQIDRQIRAVDAAPVHRDKEKVLNVKAKLSIYCSIHVPTLTHGHQLWLLTKRDMVDFIEPFPLATMLMFKSNMSLFFTAACPANKSKSSPSTS